MTLNGAPAARPVADDSEPSLGQIVKDVSTHLSTVVHGEIELAKIELKSSVKKVGVGAALLVVVAVVLLYALTFFFIAVAEYLSWQFHFWRWASFLTVFGGMILLICLPLTLLGIRSLKKVRAPERTIATTKSTVEALRHRGNSDTA